MNVSKVAKKGIYKYLKFIIKKDYLALKQELLTMHLQKFGKINLMIAKVIFGA